MPVSETEAVDAVAMLPESSWIRTYVVHATRQTTAPLVYHIGVGIAVLGTTCPIPYGMHYAGALRANNFVLCVGRSGEDRKSTALNIGKDLLDQAANPLIGDYPGSAEGLIESLAEQESQFIPISEFGKFLSSGQRGYFEPIKTLLADAWDCLSEDTEILSSTGWRKIDSLAEGETVWALDPATDKLVQSKVLDVGSRAVRDGERMVTLTSKRHSIRTTEGHRYYIKYRDPRNNYGPSPRYLVKTGAEMAARKSSYYLPFSADPQTPAPGLDLTDDELRFIAWALADSSISDKPSLVLYQIEHKYLGHLRALLSRLGMTWGETLRDGATNFGSRTSACVDLRVTRASWEPYEKYLDKDLAPDLLGMSPRQFAIFWQELLLADGEQVETAGSPGYLWSTRSAFIDRLQHLAVISGKSTQFGTRVLPSGKTAYRMSVTTNRHVCTDPSNPKSVCFSFSESVPGERVWCATTEHGTLVTRREGKVVILGNCHPQQRAKAARQGTRVVVRADNPRLSIGAACSIPYLEKHTLAEDWTGGFMGRWLVLYGRRERTDPNPVGDSRLTQTLVDGLRLRANMATAGWCTGLTQQANTYWNNWYYDVSSRKLPGNIIGIRARAPTMARKIALVLGWDYGAAQAGQPWKMGLDLLEPAIAITELHIRSLVDLSDVIAEHADARMRRSVIDAIDSKGGTATFGEILGRLKMRKRPVQESLEALLEEGRVKRLNTSLGFAYELQ